MEGNEKPTASDADRIAELERRVDALEKPAAAAAPEPEAPTSTVDGKIGRIVDAAREETERGRAARRQP